MSVGGPGRFVRCPSCHGKGEIPCCAKVTCNRPSIGTCILCDGHVCLEHRVSRIGAVGADLHICADCQPEATMERVHRRARA